MAAGPLAAEQAKLFEARVHGFNQGNRNLDIHMFHADGEDAGYHHNLQCSIVYWAGGDTTFPFTLTYNPGTQQVSWVVDTPDSGTLTTTSPTSPPVGAVDNLRLHIKATAGTAVSTCNAVPNRYCQAGGWDCNVTAQVDSSAVYLTDLQLDGVPLADLSVSASLADPLPSETVDVAVNPSQPWTLTGNVRFTWVSANGYPPKEGRILFSASGQHICVDEDEDGYYVEGGGCGPADCDDADPAVHPGENESCTNSIDDDCDGLADGEDPECWECTVPAECDDSDPCTDDDCVAYACVYTNNTAPCDDGNACTMDDVCAGGACSGVPLDQDGDTYVSDACGGDDCLDSDPDVNPGVFEAYPGDPACSDGIDNNCNGYTDSQDAGCAEVGGWALGESADASVYGTPSSREGSAISNLFLAVLVPVGAVVFLRRFLAGR
jgi:hypothetical protein